MQNNCRFPFRPERSKSRNFLLALSTEIDFSISSLQTIISQFHVSFFNKLSHKSWCTGRCQKGCYIYGTEDIRAVCFLQASWLLAHTPLILPVNGKYLRLCVWRMKLFGKIETYTYELGDATTLSLLCSGPLDCIAECQSLPNCPIIEIPRLFFFSFTASKFLCVGDKCRWRQVKLLGMLTYVCAFSYLQGFFSGYMQARKISILFFWKSYYKR